MNDEPTPVWRQRLVRSYRSLALLLLGTLIVVVAVNLAAAAVLVFFRGRLDPPPGALRYEPAKLALAYPHRSREEIAALLNETWSRRYVYSPFVQHREGPARGRFVNVAAEGFRLSADQGPWPPEDEALIVFVFGGSTTFGYGVADEETIPSRLQQALGEYACEAPPRIYNFGRGNYYSEQERVLFESLITAGSVPDVALFIDGLNEWKESPKFTARLEHLLRESDVQLVARALKTLPVVRLLEKLRGDGGDPGAESDEGDRRMAEVAVRRWLRSKRAIEAVASDLAVVPVFVWQPVPVHGYELEFHLFADESSASFAAQGALRHGYRLMDRSRAGSPELARNFLWLADMQQGRREPLYVDAAHYTAAFSEEIARRIAAFVAAALPCTGAEATVPAIPGR